MQEAQDKLFLADGKLQGLAFQLDQMKTPRVLTTPMPAMPPIRLVARGGDDGLYQRGLAAIDAHHYDEAVEAFNQVVAHAGSRTEGGLYWKAYTLNKLGRSADALAAIDQLRKGYPSSRWLDDAKALEVEVKQSSGKAVSPEGETDEDIKILALNGLMQSDPERALPQVENLLKTSHSPKLKRQAIIVMGLNSSPRARQYLEQIARGFHVPAKTVKRYVKRLREGSSKSFFEIPQRRSASVLKGEVKEQAQALLDEGQAVPEVARKLGVLPNTLHKAIRTERLHQPKKRI